MRRFAISLIRKEEVNEEASIETRGFISSEYRNCTDNPHFKHASQACKAQLGCVRRARALDVKHKAAYSSRSHEHCSDCSEYPKES